MHRRYLIGIGLAALLAALSACSEPAPPVAGGAAEVPDGCNFDSAAPSTTFDIVINNGRVMDPECDFDGVRNVGIQDGRIAVITQGTLEG